MSETKLAKEDLDAIKKEIVMIGKAEGLEIIEDTAVAAVKSSFKIVKIILPKVSIAVAAILVPILELVEPKILAMLDKIDGIDDPNY